MMDKKMPYPHDKESKMMIGEKIKKLMHEGKGKAQSVAIALSMARARKKK